MKKKSLLKGLSIIGVVVAMLITSSISVFAATTPRFNNNYYLAEGVGHIDYYITPSASGYTSLINNAANNWVYTGFGVNPIYMYQTSNSNVSNMDIYNADSYEAYMTANSIDGMTVFVDVRTSGHVEVDPTQSFWDYGRIYLNQNFFNGYSDTVKQGVIAHEMGHVMALDHNTTTQDSLMWPYTDTRQHTVRKVDHDGINAIYH